MRVATAPLMRIARGDLKLERISVVYLGARRYTLAENIHAVPLDAVADGMADLFKKGIDSSELVPSAKLIDTIGQLEMTGDDGRNRSIARILLSISLPAHWLEF
jgi:hypothetical protein